jgi:integrase
MSTANVSVFIDRYHPQKDGKCKISIRITHDRKRRYYPTDLTLTASDFDRIINAKRKNDEDKKTYLKIDSFKSKAIKAVDIPVFTFDLFEDIYLNNRGAVDSLKFAFEKYIDELKDEKRIGTAVTYECAMNSILAFEYLKKKRSNKITYQEAIFKLKELKKKKDDFKSSLKFADITPNLLTKYENTMIESGNSKTTVGIYLRSLRTIFNRAKIDSALYPFGKKDKKYIIPTGRNIKKALKLDDISKIFKYVAPSGSFREMSKDYWIFLYLCNGMNVKDMCLLKWKDIDGDVLTYERAKTMRSKQESTKIKVSLKDESKTIIRKWGTPSLDKNAFIFPHLQKGMTAEREREVYQQLTKIINKHIKQIAKELDIQKDVTTYFARHSFATILRNSGASVNLISNLLGHGDIKTTENYLDGFEQEIIHQTTDALLGFAK